MNVICSELSLKYKTASQETTSASAPYPRSCCSPTPPGPSSTSRSPGRPTSSLLPSTSSPSSRLTQVCCCHSSLQSLMSVLASGFPGSPDLMDQTSLLEAGSLNKPLGKLAGPPDVLKYCGPAAPAGQNPSIIKHTTDPRLHQRPGVPPLMMVNSNNKIQRRYSHQSQVSLLVWPGQPETERYSQDCPVPINQLQQAAITSSNKARLVSGQTVINTKAGPPPPQQQQQQQQQLVRMRNGKAEFDQFVRVGRPSIVQHSAGILRPQQTPPQLPAPASRPQLMAVTRPPAVVARSGLVLQHQIVNRPMQPPGPRPIALQTRHRPVLR